MKNNLLLFVVLCLFLHSKTQSIVTSSSSESGILVGGNNDFVGLKYETASDKVSFNYKFAKQDSCKQDTSKFKYPHFWGLNFGSGINIEKGKANIFTEKKWQGGISFDFTAFRTWDTNTPSKEAEPGEEGINHAKIKRMAQYTIYFRVSNALERFNNFTSKTINPDTTFLFFDNPMQTTFTLTPGFMGVHQLSKSSFFISYATSVNFHIINKSTRKLKELNLTSVGSKYYNLKDSSLIQDFGKSKSYYNGTGEQELYMVPRIDLFMRYRFENQWPTVGLLMSYSPMISSFSDIKVRHNVVIGPTFGLSSLPDQVVFALLNEVIQDANGDFKYSLTFNVSFPIKIK